MKFTVKFECFRNGRKCSVQTIDYENLDDLLGSLAESGWPICCECGEDTSYTIIKFDEIVTDMNVEELIAELMKVEDKRQVVAGCIRGIEVGESLIVEVVSEEPDANDDIGFCWLKFRENSSIHQD